MQHNVSVSLSVFDLNTGSTLQHNGDPQNTTGSWLFGFTVFYSFFSWFYGEIPAAVFASNLLFFYMPCPNTHTCSLGHLRAHTTSGGCSLPFEKRPKPTLSRIPLRSEIPSCVSHHASCSGNKSWDFLPRSLERSRKPFQCKLTINIIIRYYI